MQDQKRKPILCLYCLAEPRIARSAGLVFGAHDPPRPEKNPALSLTTP